MCIKLSALLLMILTVTIANSHRVMNMNLKIAKDLSDQGLEGSFDEGEADGDEAEESAPAEEAADEASGEEDESAPAEEAEDEAAGDEGESAPAEEAAEGAAGEEDESAPAEEAADTASPAETKDDNTEFFDKLDKDGDGVISEKEAAAMVVETAPVTSAVDLDSAPPLSPPVTEAQWEEFKSLLASKKKSKAWAIIEEAETEFKPYETWLIETKKTHKQEGKDIETELETEQKNFEKAKNDLKPETEAVEKSRMEVSERKKEFYRLKKIGNTRSTSGSLQATAEKFGITSKTPRSEIWKLVEAQEEERKKMQEAHDARSKKLKSDTGKVYKDWKEKEASLAARKKAWTTTDEKIQELDRQYRKKKGDIRKMKSLTYKR